MPQVEDADQVESIVKGDLEKWFNVRQDTEFWRGPHIWLEFEWLNVHLEEGEWVVSSYARKFVMMGGGTRKTWWGGKRFVVPWSKVLQQEPFHYRVERATGRFVEKDHNLSPTKPTS